MNLNVTRVNGNPINERDRTRAELEVERQGYVAADFLRKYVPGFANALLLEVAPRLGVLSPAIRVETGGTGDGIAMGSMRSTPACALMGEAAGVAASLAAQGKTSVRKVDVQGIQKILLERGIPLGTPGT